MGFRYVWTYLAKSNRTDFPKSHVCEYGESLGEKNKNPKKKRA